MIIVSQNKRRVINFDNVEVLNIDYANGKVAIFSETTSDNLYSLGEYETEERAKEILKNITEMFGVDEIVNSTYELADITMKLKHLKIFRMPEK